MNEFAAPGRRFESDYQTRERRSRGLGASIAEHPLLWTVAVVFSLPLLFALVGLAESVIAWREWSNPNPSMGGPYPPMGGAIKPYANLIVLFGPFAFLSWAYLWRALHRGRTKDREQRDQADSIFTVAGDTSSPKTASLRSQAGMPSHSPAAEIHQQLDAPANGLLITGIIDCALLPLGLIAGLAIFFYERPSHGFGNVGAAELLILVVMTFMSVIGIPIVIGALKMKHVESRRFAIASSILALVPRFPLSWFLGVPMGIWSLIVLASPEVKAAFAGVKRDRTEPADLKAHGVPNGNRIVSPTVEPSSKRTVAKLALALCLGGTLLPIPVALAAIIFGPHFLLLAFLLFVALQVTALILGVVAHRERLGRGTAIASALLLLLSLVLLPLSLLSLSRVTVREVTPPGPPGAVSLGPAKTLSPEPEPTGPALRGTPTDDSLRWWVMGPQRPRLKDEITRYQLTASQVAPVNRALQESYREYLALEKQNMKQSTNEQGHVTTVIPPLLKELSPIEGRLWSRLDAILDRDQQNSFRLNLELYPREAHEGVSLREIVRPGLFGWGQLGSRIEISRDGAWFRWNVSTGAWQDSSTAPELPEEYRRFWKEPSKKKTTAPSGS